MATFLATSSCCTWPCAWAGCPGFPPPRRLGMLCTAQGPSAEGQMGAETQPGPVGQSMHGCRAQQLLWCPRAARGLSDTSSLGAKLGSMTDGSQPSWRPQGARRSCLPRSGALACSGASPPSPALPQGPSTHSPLLLLLHLPHADAQAHTQKHLHTIEAPHAHTGSVHIPAHVHT